MDKYGHYTWLTDEVDTHVVYWLTRSAVMYKGRSTEEIGAFGLVATQIQQF